MCFSELFPKIQLQHLPGMITANRNGSVGRVHFGERVLKMNEYGNVASSKEKKV